jgi:hypothetical protein
MSDDECAFGSFAIVASGSDAPARGSKRRRPESPATFGFSDVGRCRLVCILGAPDGRWSGLTGDLGARFQHYVDECFFGRPSLLAQAAQHLDGTTGDRVAVLGFAVIAWKFLSKSEVLNSRDLPSSTRMLFDIERSQRDLRVSVGGIAYMVEASAMLSSPVSIVRDQMPESASPRLYNFLLDLCAGCSVFDFGTGGAEGSDFLTATTALETVLLRWSSLYRLSRRSVIRWKVSVEFGVLLLAKFFLADVVAVVRRDHSRNRMVPSEPQVNIENSYLDQLVVHGVSQGHGPVEEAEETSRVATKPFRMHARGCIMVFSAQHLVRGLAASQHLKCGRHLTSAVRDILRFALPSKYEELRPSLDSSVLQLPEKSTLVRARARLDVVCMLANREMSSQRLDSVIRHINFDKSPQRVEVLAFCEEMFGMHGAGPLESRYLPLSAMGYNACAIPHTVWAIVHKVWLEYGPTATTVRAWFASVRSVLTDHHSVESVIVDQEDVVDEFIAMAPGSADREFVYWFPNAIRIIGVNHTLDNVLKLVICSIPFYAAFQERAKALCRFLRNDSYRLVLQALEDGSSRSVFTCFSANFAKWRWGTLASVCSELIRVEQDLVFPTFMSLACYQVCNY